MRNSWAEGPALATVKSTRPPLTVGGVAWIVKSLSTTAMFGTALAAVTDFVRALRTDGDHRGDQGDHRQHGRHPGSGPAGLGWCDLMEGRGSLLGHGGESPCRWGVGW